MEHNGFKDFVPNIWKKLASSLRGVPKVPLLLLAGFLFVAIFADFLAPHDPEVGNFVDLNRPPFWQQGGSTKYLLGTDHVGRDVLSRLIFGARISVTLSVLAVLWAGGIGTILGVISGFLGGAVDEIMMRLVDGWVAFPGIFLAILLAVVMGPGVHNMLIVLTAVFWSRYARVIRGEVLAIKERDFVQLAITAGCSKIRIMRKHIVPNVINTAIVIGTLQIGVVVVLEAALSFVGVGVQSPTPAWGLMLSDGRMGMMAGHWWTSVFPGLGIVLLVMSANLLGDWLRVRLDPRLQQVM